MVFVLGRKVYSLRLNVLKIFCQYLYTIIEPTSIVRDPHSLNEGKNSRSVYSNQQIKYVDGNRASDSNNG